MTDSWMPMKLEAHMANMYSMFIDRKRSTMKSDAYFFGPAAAAGAAACGCASCACDAATGIPGVAAIAAVATPFRKSRRRTGGFSDMYVVSAFRRTSKVPANADLEDPALDDRGRLQPGAAVGAAVAVGQRQRRVRVERVVEIEVRVERALADLEDLREPDVELVQPIAEHRVRHEGVDGLLTGRAGGERPAERRRQLRAGINDARLNARPRQALEVAADAQAVPRQLVVRDELCLRLPSR